MKSKLLSRIIETYHVFEAWDLRIGAIWLNPREVAFLETEEAEFFDKVHDPRVRDAFLDTHGGPYVGVLFGAMVFSSEIVVPGHIAILPSGFQAKLVDSTACISLGLGVDRGS